MQRPYLLLLLLLVCLAGCGPGKKLFQKEALPPARSARELLAALPTQAYERLRYSGIGTWEQGGKQQRFRFDLRLIRDSVVWIDLADPVLGIRAARALLRPDTAAFYNRLQKQYLTGRPAQLAQKIALSFQYDWLWPLLTAQPLPLGKKRYLKRDSGQYILSNAPLSRPPQGSATTAVLKFSTQPRLRLSAQSLYQPDAHRTLQVRYKTYHPEHRLPTELVLEYQGPRPGRLILKMQSVQPGENFNLPFRIPNGYAPLD